ncbi:aspartate kinase [bacterium]|nr:aspartate kinase [bacterium]
MIVMKFGGASLNSPESIKNVVEIIKSRRKEKPVIVLSAMAKTTRSLLLCAEEYAEGNREKGDQHLEDLRKFHFRMAESLLENEFLYEVSAGMDKYFKELSESLNAFFALKELSPRSQDSVLCYGELLSTLIVESCLRQDGINSKLLDSRKIIITDKFFTAAQPVFGATEKLVLSIIAPLAAKGFIPVLQGFIGSTEEGIPATLGFEGSDYTASIIGAALKADAIQIWKNVPGIMSADPDVVRDAETVRTLTFSEAEELTFLGAKVLHPSSIEPARKLEIPVTIRNTNEIDGDFTSIVPDQADDDVKVKSITCLKNLILLKFQNADSNNIRTVLSDMEKNCLKIYLSTYLHNSINLVVRNGVGAERFISAYGARNNLLVKKRIALVTLVGRGIGNEPEIAESTFKSLNNSGIDYEIFVNMEMSLAIVLEETSAEGAVLSLHNDLLCDK